MVSTNSESRRDILRRELIDGVTQCEGIVNGAPCTVIHKSIVLSKVDGKPVVFHLKYGVIVDGEAKPICTMCRRREQMLGRTVMPYDEAVRLAEQMLLDGTTIIDAPVAPLSAATAPRAAMPVAPPAPVMPAVGRLPAGRHGVPVVLKDAPGPQPLAARAEHPAPRKEERKPEANRGPSPRSLKGHLRALDAAKSFDVFVLKANKLCSCGDCDTKSGKGFVTRNGDYKGQRFPLCPEGVKAAIHFVSGIRREGRKPGVLVFSDEGDWKRFDQGLVQKTKEDAIRGHAVLDGEFTKRDGICSVDMCKTAKPTDRIARIVDGKVVEHAICGKCAAAARKLQHQLQEEGKRWDFQLLREGQKLSEKQAQSLRHAAKMLQAEKSQQKPASKSKSKPASSGKGSMSEQMARVAQEIEAKKAKASEPPVAPAQTEPEATEPAPESTSASITMAAPEAPPTAPEEDAMGGGS